MIQNISFVERTCQFFNSVRNHFHFLLNYLKKPEVIGSIWPSSPQLAERMVTTLKIADAQPRHILEVGAGTGVITKVIIPLLRTEDTLDVVECERDLAEMVRKVARTSGKHRQVTVHEAPIETYETTKKYTHIISSLPLTSFSKTLVHQVYAKFQELINEEGTLSYFEYMGMCSFRLLYYTLTLQHDAQENLAGIRHIKEHHLGRDPQQEKIWWNLLPARVWHVTLQKRDS